MTGHLNIYTDRSRLFAETMPDGGALIQIDTRGAWGSLRATLDAGKRRELAAFLLDMREEWGVRWDDGTLWDHYLNQEEAQAGAGDGTDPTDGTVVHRHVTDWETP